MSSLSTALTRSFRTTPGMIRTRAAHDRAISGHTVALETFLRISGEMPEILIDTLISPGQAWQTAPAGAPLVSGLPPDIVGRPP